MYALQYKSKTDVIYIFKDSKIQYEELLEGRTLECIGCFANNRVNKNRMFGGFLSSLYDIITNAKSVFGNIQMNNLGQCSQILEFWIQKYKPILETSCFYYLYNAIVPHMPLDQNQCMILL